MLAALLKMRASESRQQGRSERLRRFVHEHYRWRDVAKRTYAIYADVLADKDRYETPQHLPKWRYKK